jgi:hypothetical protein
VRLNYNQKTWVAKVSPIWGTELFMVVMYDKTINYYKDARVIFFGFIFLLSTMILVVSYSFIVRICLLFLISVLATVFIDSVDTALFHVLYLLSFLSLLASALLTKKTYLIRHFWWKENRLVTYQLIIFALINISIIVFIINKIYWPEGRHTTGYEIFMLMYPLLSLLMLNSIRTSKRLYKYHYVHEVDTGSLPLLPYRWIKFENTYKQYLIFFFMWLLLISLGPTVLFFKVSYLSENRLWNKWQQMHLVEDWLEQRHEGIRNTSSLKMDSICLIEVAEDQKYDHNLITNESINELTIDKRILKDLRMPVTGNKEDMSGFLFENATDSLYFWKEDTLFYHDAIDQKMIKVSPSEYNFEKLITNKSSIALWIALIVFLAIAYQAMRYLINMIFYSEPSNHLLNINPDLNELINQVDSDRNILIVGYDSNEALRKYQANWPEYEIVSLLDEKQVEKIVEHSYLSSGKRKKFIFLNFDYINGGLKEFKNVVEVLQKLSLRREHKVVLGCATDIDVLRHKLTAKIKQSQYSEDDKKEQQWLITRLDQLLADYMEMQLPLVYLENCADENRIKRQKDIREHVVLDDFIKRELSYGYFLHDIRCNAYIDKTIAASSDDIYRKKDLWKVNIRESLNELLLFYWKKLRGKNPRRTWRPVKSILDFNYENMLMTPGAADELRNRKENIVLRVNNIAENYYQYLWNNCSAEEKLILYDLAEDEITNSKNRYVLKKLIKKGLIIHDSKLRIFNLSFRNFIMTFTRKDEATMLESAARSKGRWNNSRLILLTIILSALIFMFIAEQSIIDKALGLLSASIAILPALYKLFDSLLKSSTVKPDA